MDNITDTDINDDPWEPWRPTAADIRATWEMRVHAPWRLPSERAELAARSDIPADLRAELLSDPDTVAAGRHMVATGRGAIFDCPSVFFDTDAGDGDNRPPDRRLLRAPLVAPAAGCRPATQRR